MCGAHHIVSAIVDRERERARIVNDVCLMRVCNLGISIAELTHLLRTVALEQMDVQQRIARILQQIHEPVLRPHNAHERIGVRRRRFRGDERKVSGLRFAGVRTASEHPTDADHVLDVVAKLLLEVAVIGLQLAVLDADGQLRGEERVEIGIDCLWESWVRVCRVCYLVVRVSRANVGHRPRQHGSRESRVHRRRSAPCQRDELRLHSGAD